MRIAASELIGTTAAVAALGAAWLLRGQRRGEIERLEAQVAALAALEQQLAAQTDGLSNREIARQRRLDRLEGERRELERDREAGRYHEAALERELHRLRLQTDLVGQKTSTLEADAARLKAERDEAVGKADQLAKDNEALHAQLDEAQAKVRDHEAAQLLSAPSSDPPFADLSFLRSGAPDAAPAEAPDGPAAVESFAELVQIAREHLKHIELPQSAERELDKLDAAEEANFWADEAWKGLQALNEYARKAAEFKGGFWEWCKHAGAKHQWPAHADKLAMNESQTVTTSKDLSRAREFDVSTDVRPSGRIKMFPHLKIAAKGGENIPRIYFHDDAKGKTGKIHIGFIGPHRLVPTKRSS